MASLNPIAVFLGLLLPFEATALVSRIPPFYEKGVYQALITVPLHKIDHPRPRTLVLLDKVVVIPKVITATV